MRLDMYDQILNKCVMHEMYNNNNNNNNIIKTL